MDTRARLGFVGAGSHANSRLYPSLVQAPSAHLVAVCDLDAGRAELAAKRYGADRWYTDVETMLAKEELQGVYICGVPSMHSEVGRQVLKHRLPIFVEKPSAMNAKEGKRLADAATKAGTWGMVAFMKRHAAAYQLAKELTESKSFGGVQQIHLQFTQGEYPDIWGLEAPLAFLVGQLIHIFDLTRYLAGDIAEVHARLNRVREFRFGYAVSLSFTSGAVGTMTLSALDHVLPWRDITEHVHICGVGESVTIDDMQSVTHYPAEDWRPAGQQRFGIATRRFDPNWLAAGSGKDLLGYVGEVEHFAQCVRDNKPASASLEDGVESLRFAEAIWRSAQTGRAVKLTT